MIFLNSFLLLFYSVFCVAAAYETRASFGETCNNHIRCSSRASLTCGDDGICHCIKEAEMTFDTKLRKCVVLAGERCKYEEKYDCVENAKCGRDGFCGCNPNFFESSNGTCIQKLGYGDACSKNEECDDKFHLSCNNKDDGQGRHCSCNSTDAIYESEKEKCVGKVGVDFWKYQDCVKHASEKSLNDGRSSKYLCSCSDGFMKTVDNTCTPKLKYGGNCSQDEECDVNLICMGGQCMCNGSDWMYDFHRDGCFVKVGQTCEHGYNYYNTFSNGERITRPCVANANCSHRICSCRGGYSTNGKYTPGFVGKNGLCYGEYDVVGCHPTISPCLYDLSCINKKCTCPYPEYQVFDKASKKCVSNLHGPCSVSVEGTTKNFTCSDVNMECRNDYGVYECLCAKGYIESKTGDSCIGAHESPCTDQNDCDQVAGLMCWNGTCRCRDFEEYDESTNLCVGLVGAKCGNVRERKIACKGTINNGMICRPPRNRLLTAGVCRCRISYRVDSDRMCERVFNTSSEEAVRT